MTIKVFVGCAANGEDIESQMVLEHSLRRHCSRDVDITWMMLSRDPASPFAGWRTDLWSTPFSGFRWAVPELCGWQGRALYMDSDMIVRADIADLWDTEIRPGRIVVAKGGHEGWRFCVSLWDCERAADHIPFIGALKPQPAAHRKMVNYLRARPHLVQAFAGNWNCIDGEDYVSIDDPDIRILHYSSEAHQPQLRHALPRLEAAGARHWFDGTVKRHWRPEVEALFDHELELAIEDGYSVDQYRPAVPYGAYVKKSEKNYRSHKWAK